MDTIFIFIFFTFPDCAEIHEIITHLLLGANSINDYYDGSNNENRRAKLLDSRIDNTDEAINSGIYVT